MLKIKKALEIAGASILTLVGVEKALADTTNVAVPDTSKKIEITQPITQPDTARVDTTLETITVNSPKYIGDSTWQDSSRNWNSNIIIIKNKKFGEQVISSDTSITIVPDKKDGFYQDSLSQVELTMNDLRTHPLIGFAGKNVKFDTTSQSLKPKKKPASKKENRIYSSDENFAAFLGGIFGGQIEPDMILTSDYLKDLNPSFSSANKDSLEFEFLPAKKALKNAGIYLKPIVDSTEAGKIINFHRKTILSKLERISKDPLYKSAEYDSSLQILNEAVKDGVIKGKELFDENNNCKVEDGLYVLNVKSKPSKGYNGNSFPIILDITSQKDAKNLTLNIYGFPAFALGFEDSVKTVTFENNKPVEKDSTVIPTQAKADSEELKINFKTPSKSKTSLIIGGHAGQNGLKGVDFGVQYGRIAVLGNYSVGGDENLETITGSTSSTGIQGTVETNNTNCKAFGASLEYHPSNFFFGGGFNRWGYDKVEEVKITRSDGTAKRKTDTESQSEISEKFYAGYGRNISTNTKLEWVAGYDTYKKAFVGARINHNF